MGFCMRKVDFGNSKCPQSFKQLSNLETDVLRRGNVFYTNTKLLFHTILRKIVLDPGNLDLQIVLRNMSLPNIIGELSTFLL